MQTTLTLNRIVLLISAWCCFSASAVLMAQSANCSLSPDAGGTLAASGGVVSPDGLSPDPMLSGESAGLSFVQYVFTNPNDEVFDSISGLSGARIIFANNSGQVVPSDLGLEVGDQFCVSSLSFSLDILQRQVDTLYGSEFFGVPCCDFAEVSQGVDVCSLMVDAGIIEGADLEDYNDLADFAVAYGIQASLESIFFLVDSFINIVPPGSPCTAGAPMCYAVSNTVCFSVDTVSAVGGINASLDWALFPNPARLEAQLEFTTDRSGTASIELFDAQGKLVMEQSFQHLAGHHRQAIALSELAPGLYQVVLHSQEGRASKVLLVE
jgi:hypothetical protein